MLEGPFGQLACSLPLQTPCLRQGAKWPRKNNRGHVAEWLRSGLQIRVPRFNSGRGLQKIQCKSIKELLLRDPRQCC